MSLTMPLESCKGILLSVRVIKVLLPPQVVNHSPCIVVKIGGHSWQVHKSNDFPSQIIGTRLIHLSYHKHYLIILGLLIKLDF